ncbi:D-Ala-D-Ala carboxypeptidase family metallohydrolase [Sphingomonas jaspsi]|uniref:D-Ala-D-Ala carboxypeptidase family metallohydrolase n=1 Tax=Sphingomonas jaspsi TaxID=392409 RepID=UPI0004BCD139|nr:D-Ala-D-Ala carboxypeptidase family metallohydrolase [Sphingomonas jaspsi]
MLRGICAILLAGAAGAASAAPNTDWGIRAVSGDKVTPKTVMAPGVSEPIVRVPTSQYVDPAVVEPVITQKGSFSIGSAASVGGRFGRVTSTFRSVAHNRAVGGMPNSYHLRGRAIDIARRPGVAHWQIAAAYRAAGYNLLESLDEGDHSHFAFGAPGEIKRRAFEGPRPQMVIAKADGQTQWRIVYAPAGGGN